MSDKVFPPMDGYVYERVKVGDSEYEIYAPQEYVEPRVNAVLERMTPRRDAHAIAQSAVVTQLELPLQAKENTPSSANDSVSLEVNYGAPHNGIHIDLRTFYRKTVPQSQFETFIVILYHMQIHEGKESMNYDDCEQGYNRLQSEGVIKPANIRQQVKQGVDYKHDGKQPCPLIYKPDYAAGKFALTRKGLEYVETRLIGNS